LSETENGGAAYDYSFKKEISGDAPKGICYRVLVPALCSAAQDLTPTTTREWLGKISDIPPLRDMDLDRDLMPAYAMVGFIALLSFSTMGLLLGPLSLIMAWAAIGPMAGLGDPATLLAFSLATWALMNGRRPAFWAAFAIASLNRETAPLILMFALFRGWEIKPLVVGAVLWIALRLSLYWAFCDNSAGMCWPLLERNLKLIQPISATTAIAATAFFCVLARGAMQSENWLRYSLVIGSSILIVMACLWSRPERLRTYLEMLPVASVVLGCGIKSLLLGVRGA